MIRLRSGERIAGDPKEASISLQTDFGLLKVPLKEVVSFRFDDTKKHWSVKTGKSLLTGQLTKETMEWETPAGSISVPLTEMAEFVK
jgi:hypothetical protein